MGLPSDYRDIMTNLCDHGQLRRQCEICERDERITTLERELAEARAGEKGWRDSHETARADAEALRNADTCDRHRERIGDLVRERDRAWASAEEAEQQRDRLRKRMEEAHISAKDLMKQIDKALAGGEGV